MDSDYNLKLKEKGNACNESQYLVTEFMITSLLAFITDGDLALLQIHDKALYIYSKMPTLAQGYSPSHEKFNLREEPGAES